MWLSGFMNKYNLKYRTLFKTEYSKTEMLGQLTPSLELTWALRFYYGIGGGVGKISNFDESMTYMFEHRKKYWTI